ncbi:hypothetical protein C8J56DRAFT_1025481 [Mycena floridula]|nr:hypothetical protein C8J56DRAFT_1025481 [Mycena floridula]
MSKRAPKPYIKLNIQVSFSLHSAGLNQTSTSTSSINELLRNLPNLIMTQSIARYAVLLVALVHIAAVSAAPKGKPAPKKAPAKAKAPAPAPKPAPASSNPLSGVGDMANAANQASGKSGGPLNALGLDKFNPMSLLGIRDLGEGAIEELD